MKTLFITQKGVKRNASLHLDSIKSILHNLKSFLGFIHSFWDFDLNFLHRFIHEDYVQLVHVLTEHPPKSLASSKLRDKILKENLFFILPQYLQPNARSRSILDFEPSPLFIK